MDYDRNYNKLKKSFYDSQFSKKILVNGYVCLNNAKLKKTQEEYYVLVTYNKGEKLPKEYIPIDQNILEPFGVLETEHFATVNPELNFNILEDRCKIKRITKLGKTSNENYQYLIGTGPEVFTILDLVYEQLELKQKESKRIRKVGNL